MRASFAATTAVLLACTALVVPALAADRPLLVKAKPLPVAASWTQFYVGGGIGLNVETGTTTVVVPPPSSTVVTVGGLEGANLGLTATAGFDYQLSPLVVVGAFADYDWSGRSTTISATDDFGDFASATAARLVGGWTVGGRAGILVNPNVLVYGLGGFTQMRLDNWSATDNADGLVALQEPSRTLNGYTVGGGIEYRLTNNVSVRGEYRYASLGSKTTADTTNGLVSTTGTSVHIARVEAAYRFGGPSVSAPAVPTKMAAAGWTGFYGGLGLGGDAIATHVSSDDPLTEHVTVDGLGGGDVAGTATLGFDYQVQNWVAGVFGLVDIGANGNARLTINGFVGGGSISSEVSSIDNSWTAGGRIGYLIAPDALVYALAGYSVTNFHSVTYELTPQFGPPFSGTASASAFHGVTFGGGFEKLITGALSARVEYRNTSYDTQTGFSAPGFPNIQARPTVNSVRVLVDYRFSTMK